MNSITVQELNDIAQELTALVGAQLQDVFMTTSEVGLAFYQQREIFWLWFDLQPQRPCVVRFIKNPPPRKKQTKPLALFIKAHLTGKRLSQVSVPPDLGRVLILQFHAADSDFHLEIRLFPHGQNIFAFAQGKSLSLLKPKDLPVQSDSGAEQERAKRSWSEIQEQWEKSQNTRAVKVQASDGDSQGIEKEWRRSIEKRQRALEKMRETLAQQKSDHWAEIGEWLKVHATLNVPSEWQEFIDPAQSLSWNIERCFHRQKENQRKQAGTQERLLQIEKEIALIMQKGPQAPGKTASPGLMKKAQVRGRTLTLSADLEAYIGKSAADNLALLRKAQPFDYWLHLRDQPGAHAILRRTRNRAVSDVEFLQTGRWLIEQSLHKSAEALHGEKFEMLIVECRYVRPIKGDKLGRVHYTNDRVIRIGY